ncbi:MAG: glycosyltransferase [Acidobacteriota bacterium]|nr:glycosyltransferase [Acidobacteriota bacterium]
MRILHLVSVWDGGVRGQVLAVSQRLAAQGHTVRVLALRCKASAEDDPSVAVIELLRQKSLMELLRAVFRARREIRAFAPDVVHGHSFHAILLARLLRLVAPIPYLVSTFHTSAGARNTLDGGPRYTIPYRLTDPLGDISTNVCREAAESFVRAGAVPRRRIVTVYDGIDTAKFAPNPAPRAAERQQLALRADQFLWLAVGRLCQAKDYPTLLRAFAQLASQSPSSVLAIAGDGPLEAGLRAYAVSLDLGPRVRFLGRCEDVPRLLQAADAYVLSSAWEGFPNGLAEAMSTALPVVSTACCGADELLGTDAAPVPVGDAAALAARMLDVERMTPTARRDLGFLSRQRVVERFSLEHCCQSWLALYASRIRRAGA